MHGLDLQKIDEKDETETMAKQPEKTKAEIYREQRKARLAKEAAKKQRRSNRVVMKKSTKTAIVLVIVIALVAGIAGFAFGKSAKYKRPVLSIDGLGEVSVAEYSFYYRLIANNYFQTGYYYGSQYGSSYATMFTGGYDYTQSPDVQEYGEELEGYENPTWADFFEESAKEQIMNVKAYAKLAEEKGLTLDDDDYKEIDEQIDELSDTAKENDYTLSAYLKASYGNGVTKKLFRTILEEQQLASKYETVMTEEFEGSLTEDEILAEYKEDTSAYDKVSLAYYLVEADKETTTDDEGNESESVTDATMKVAKASAQKLAENKTKKALSKAVDKFAGAENSLQEYNSVDKDTISNYISSDIAEWAYGKKISSGDTKVFEVEDSGYYVCMIIDAPFRDDTKTIDVRHILIDLTEEEEEDTTDTDATSDTDAVSEENTEDKKANETLIDVPELSAFTDATIDLAVTAETATDKEAYEKAELILRQYLNGDRTAESFGELANANSTDTGSNENGGLYEDVAPGAMITEFNDWCFDPDRKAGDVGIVETTYGYHVMYFVETNDDPEWKASIKSHLAEHAFEEFIEENVSVEKYPITVTNQAYIDSAVESAINLIKRQIQSLSSSSSLSY